MSIIIYHSISEKIDDNCEDCIEDENCSAKKLRRLAKERKFNGVIKSNVGDIRKIIPLNVRHNPTMVNYGHSLIIGLPKKRDEKLKIRSLLKDISEWVIPINMDFI